MEDFLYALLCDGACSALNKKVLPCCSEMVMIKLYQI